jgi:hypothetical protein
VTVLVEASNTQLRRSHEFPIFTDAVRYAERVGTSTQAKSGGPLHGIVHGLRLIEQVQPYHREPDPEADPLAHIHRFSNTDKHRQTLVLSERMEKPQLTFEFVPDVDPVERWFIPEWGLAVDKDTKIAAFRFIKPYPTQVSVKPGELQPLLGAPEFPPQYPTGLLVGLDVMDSLYDATNGLIGGAEAL